MRVTEQMMVRSFLGRTAGNLSALAAAQERIASGKNLLKPSDDPRALAKSLALRADLRRTDEYAENASSATAFMSITESSLQQVSDLLSRAKELVVEGANATSAGMGAPALATELRDMVDELLLVVNRDIGGRSLFAGQRTTDPAYARIGDRVVYRGDRGDVMEELGPGLRVAMNLTGPDIVETIPSRIEGAVDLDPAVSRVTGLVDLFEGVGVQTGRIRLTDSNGVSADVDLLSATSIGDVIDGINASGTSIVAGLAPDGSGIVLTDGGGGTSFTVEDIDGGDVARSLGISGDADGTTRTSVDLNPAVTENTALALLHRGAGIGSGAWTLRNVHADRELVATVDPADANTVGELMRLVEDARTADGEWLGIRAEISGRSLALESVRTQTTLVVADSPGGDSATRMGVAQTGRTSDVFALLQAAASALEAGDQDAVETAIDRFTRAIEGTAQMRGTYGARARQVLAVASNLADERIDLTVRLSDVEDADLAEQAMRLATADTVYNAGLATGSTLLGANLFNYIR